MESRRYAVIGTGAIGCYYGGLLHLSGTDVHFLSVRHADVLRREGITIESARPLHIVQLRVHEAVESMPPCDVALVCLKTTANDLLPSLLPPILRDGGIAVMIQNGLDIEREAAEALGPDRVLIGISYAAITRSAPGRVHHHAGGRIVLGAVEFTNGNRDALRQIAMELKHAGIPVTITRDIRSAQWRKLLWNIPFNALSVLEDAMPHELVSDPSTRARIESIMQEVLETANACGCALEKPVMVRLLEETRHMPPYLTSMKSDYDRGRPLEMETILAAPLREAAKHGVAAVQLQTLRDELRAISAQDCDSGR